MDRKEIVDYLTKKVFNGELKLWNYIILKNRQIYFERDYGKLVKSNKISPEDAFVYVDFTDYNNYYESYNRLVEYLFPLIDIRGILGITDSYLSKLGFYNTHYHYVSPATGLKYYVIMWLFSDRLVIEVVDIDVVVTNIGLRKIVVDVLGKDILTQKEISDEQISRITDELYKQKLFAGYKLVEAYNILKSYYVDYNTSLAKDALNIVNAYNRIFEPYRVVYDTKTRQQVLM
jgi:hypothetical protein